MDIHVHFNDAKDLVGAISSLITAINRGTHAATLMEAKLAEIDDKLAAMTSAVADLTQAVGEIETDLRAEHQQLLDAIAQIGSGGGAVSPEQLAAVQSATDAVGALAGRLRQAVADTPDPRTQQPPTP